MFGLENAPRGAANDTKRRRLLFQASESDSDKGLPDLLYLLSLANQRFRRHNPTQALRVHFHEQTRVGCREQVFTFLIMNRNVVDRV